MFVFHLFFRLLDHKNPSSSVFNRLYVGSLHFSITEDDLRTVFEAHGPLDFVNLHIDPELGRSKGFAFVQYTNPADAKSALEKMHGFELKGRPVTGFNLFLLQCSNVFFYAH